MFDFVCGWSLDFYVLFHILCMYMTVMDTLFYVPCVTERYCVHFFEGDFLQCLFEEHISRKALDYTRVLAAPEFHYVTCMTFCIFFTNG